VFVSIFIAEGASSLGPAGAEVDLPAIQLLLARTTSEWLNNFTQIHSDSISLNRMMERSLLDMRVLRSSIDGRDFYSAGVPWFATLFGRDSAVAALQMLAWNPDVAAHTLRLLAAYQADRIDEWRDAQPGKVLHELRVGELAHLGEIPHTPYYGTVDATPLFLILLARHATWTGDLALFDELRPNVEAALRWMDEFGDSDGDEYIEYKSSSEKGLVNQGWKDSGDAIINDDGTLAHPPISMVEVQAYKYMAKLGIAGLYERSGDSGRAQQLREQAAKLRDCFNRDFWLDDLNCYALALQNGKQPCRVVTSNPGHALWAGIADADKARQVAKRLMADDMYSGWGIRTLASGDKRYNPIGYHLGTVWPHDNAIIAAGFRRYGFDDDFRRVFTGIVDAVTYFPGYRLPELFAGFAQADYGVPVPYPVACHPQAWSAGTIPWLVESLLGLQPEAFENRLRIVRPMLPEFLFFVDLRGLRVGRGRVGLRFERTRQGRVETTVTANEGGLEVQIES
jgi:glycogen debranching enzyme